MKLDKETIVARANEVQEELGALPSDEARWHHVKALVDDAEVVVGVWQDADEPDGVGMHVVKGDRNLRTVIAEQKTTAFRFAAIPCECLEQAVALKEVAGEPPAHN